MGLICYVLPKPLDQRDDYEHIHSVIKYRLEVNSMFKHLFHFPIIFNIPSENYLPFASRIQPLTTRILQVTSLSITVFFFLDK